MHDAPPTTGPLSPAAGDPAPSVAGHEVARARLEAAATRDAVVEVALRAAREHFAHAALLALDRERLVGREAVGEDAQARARARTVEVPVGISGIFRTALEGGAPYLGPPGADPALGGVLRGLGREAPHTVLVFPIRVRDRVVAFLCADNGEAPVSREGAGSFLRLAGGVGPALERILRSGKKAAAPAPAPEPEAQRPVPLPPPAAPGRPVEVAAPADAWNAAPAEAASPPAAWSASPAETAAPTAAWNGTSAESAAPPEAGLPAASEPAAPAPDPIGAASPGSATAPACAATRTDAAIPDDGAAQGDGAARGDRAAAGDEATPGDAATPDDAAAPGDGAVAAASAASDPAAPAVDAPAPVGFADPGADPEEPPAPRQAPGMPGAFDARDAVRRLQRSARGSEERARLVALLLERGPDAAEELARVFPGTADPVAPGAPPPPVEERGPVVAALAVLGPVATPFLVPVLDEGSPPRRALAARLLGRVGDPAAFLPLADRLFDADAGVGEAALEALAALRAHPDFPPVLERLRRALHGAPPRPSVAAHALSRLARSA